MLCSKGVIPSFFRASPLSLSVAKTAEVAFLFSFMFVVFPCSPDILLLDAGMCVKYRGLLGFVTCCFAAAKRQDEAERKPKSSTLKWEEKIFSFFSHFPFLQLMQMPQVIILSVISCYSCG